MFDGISMSDYVIDFDLHKAYFLRDCLEEEISYELKEIGGTRNPRSELIIYKKLDNGIFEEITLDELIFYIHTEVAGRIWEFKASRGNSRCYFYHLFKNIDTIKQAVKNMEIILKYDNESSDEDNASDDEVNENSGITVVQRALSSVQDSMCLVQKHCIQVRLMSEGKNDELEQIESFETIEDNESLAF